MSSRLLMGTKKASLLVREKSFAVTYSTAGSTVAEGPTAVSLAAPSVVSTTTAWAASAGLDVGVLAHDNECLGQNGQSCKSLHSEYLSM